jgi:hypothetical protein
MRAAALLTIGVALTAADVPSSISRTPEAQAKLDKHLAGRVAGEPANCVKSNVTISPVGIDDHTILFKDGPRIWRNDLQAGFQCGNLGGRKSLVSRNVGIRVCKGETVNVVDLTDGSPIGGCVLGQFVPYTKP